MKGTEMRISRLIGAVGGGLLAASIALAAGIYTNNVPYYIANPLYNAFTTQAPTSLSGNAYTGQEGIPMDTNLPGGASPQTAAITINNLLSGTSVVGSATSGTMTVPSFCAGGKQTLVVTASAANTQTTPTAALCVANLPPGSGTPGLTTSPIGYTWLFKAVDAATVASTFAVTLAGGTGVSFVGPVIVAPATSNEYSCAVTGAATIVCTYIGSGL